MKLWPWVAALIFVALGSVLKAWSSKKEMVFFARAWILWGTACVMAAAASSQFLRALPLDPSLWLSKWSSLQWQLNFWTLCTGPALIGLCKDLKSDLGSFQWTGPALACGFALGPMLAGAFPWKQAAALLWPFVFLAAALKIADRRGRQDFRHVWVLALLNVLAFIHGLFLLPAWLGSFFLAALLAFGLNPGGLRVGAQALALGLAAIAVKSFMGWADPLWAPAFVCALIFAGWHLFPEKREKNRVTTP